MSTICGKQSWKCVFCSAVLLSKNSIFLTVKNWTAQMRLLCEHAEDVLLLFSHPAKKTEYCPSGSWVWARCLLASLLSPSCSCLLWKLSSHVLSAGPELAQGIQKASCSLALHKGSSTLASCYRKVCLGEKVWLFLPMLWRCSRTAVCFGSQASCCLPTRCVLPDMDGSPLCMEATQHFGCFLYCFTEERCPIMNMVTSTALHFFLSFIISRGAWLWRENSRKSSHEVTKPMLKIKLKCLTLFECAILNFMELTPYLGRKLTAYCWSK